MHNFWQYIIIYYHYISSLLRVGFELRLRGLRMPALSSAVNYIRWITLINYKVADLRASLEGGSDFHLRWNCENLRSLRESGIICENLGSLAIWQLAGDRKWLANFYMPICKQQLIVGDTQISSFKVEGELFVVEVHPGSDRTSRSVARNQVPRHKSDI